MKCKGEFRAYPKGEVGQPLRSFGADFTMSDELFTVADGDDELRNKEKRDVAKNIAKNHMEHYALRWRASHPNETCTLENIYAFPEGEKAILVYPLEEDR